MASTFFATGPRVEMDQLIRLRHLAGNLGLSLTHKSLGMHGGQYRSSQRGRGMDFEEVRLYQAGDDLRSIDWRVTARTARTHTKIFREERDRPVIIAIDQGKSMFFGSQVTYKSVMAAQLAALIAWAGLMQNDKVGGIVFNEQSQQDIKPLRNKQAVLRLLESITHYNHNLFSLPSVPRSPATPPLSSQVKGSFTRMLEQLRHIARPGSAIFLISDFTSYDDEAERLLHLVKRHTSVHALIVADTLEKNLPERGIFSITDGLAKRRFQADDTVTATRYTQAFAQHLQQVENSFLKLHVTQRVVWTHDDPHKALLHWS